MVKYLSSQLSYFLSERQARQNVRALMQYVAFVLAVIALYSALFHWIMLYVEGKQHSWITGVYWTLTVMSTLGFGDITFESDLGRAFSIAVLISGIVLLLIVLPFAFIRFFFAPWLEAQVRLRAPRRVPDDIRDHVLICRYDSLAPGLIERLALHKIPTFVIESDLATATRMHEDGIKVVTGDPDGLETYEAARVADARLVFANSSDTMNTNITLTIRQVAPAVPVVVLAEEQASVDLLELSGATHVIPLKEQLGEHLANRVNAGHAHAHVIGRYRDLLIAEFPAHATPLAGRTIRATQLRETIGVNVVGVWERGRMLPPTPDTRLSDASVVLVIGTKEQMLALDTLLVIYDTNYNPVIVVGGGRVGCSTVRALKRRDLRVHLIEREESLRAKLEGVADQLFLGDAAEREVVMAAGLEEAPSVILTTNGDATNVYLAVYCRRLNSELRIVSRVTHERNIEAIHRAGADLVLSYSTLGIESVLSFLQDRQATPLGGRVEIFTATVPPSLTGKTLAESEIGSRSGLNVITLQEDGDVLNNPPASTILRPGAEIVLFGTPEQRQAFQRAFS
jgi:Trk K+ transport system NAD-binding subunit